MLVYGKYECFVMQMLYVCVLRASYGSSQCCILHDLQFVNVGRGYQRRPYGRGILQSWSHDCLIDSHECLLLFTCTEMLWMCVLYVSFGSNNNNNICLKSNIQTSSVDYASNSDV